jgi:hypothetical protein
MAVAAAAFRTTVRPRLGSVATAFPPSWNGGKVVATPSRWATTPPSWSTPITGGNSRPSPACALATAAVVARTWASSTMLSPPIETPARCRSRTRSAASSGEVL